MARLKVVFERFERKLLPSFRHKVFALALVGVFVGLGAYLVYMSKAYSYLSDDPRVCINCHVMGPYYATWQHSSHAMRATCNDCHVPHNSIFSKYYFKAADGLRHSYVFTMRNEPQRMQAISASQAVIYDNCVRCHTQLNQEFVRTGMLTRADIRTEEEKACWDCHRDVPHGGKNSLSATPNGIISYPKSPVPQWLRTYISKKK
ncbi:cytochrome c nitrite reductase small subunit [Porphyromonas gingivalis]|uniref:cytochrome c nitrite reductase small subunit n=1 Tax=Porphyromonas gingivalis TaxID=837 RepID=UPI001B8D56C6|nr:cytochrome c nitrite reductase small subunit [Porphyromonas gingivalis]